MASLGRGAPSSGYSNPYLGAAYQGISGLYQGNEAPGQRSYKTGQSVAGVPTEGDRLTDDKSGSTAHYVGIHGQGGKWVTDGAGGGAAPPPAAAAPSGGGAPAPGPTGGSPPPTAPTPDTASMAALMGGGGKKTGGSDAMQAGAGVTLKNLGNRVPPSLAALLKGGAY